MTPPARNPKKEADALVLPHGLEVEEIKIDVSDKSPER
jgi:hypothetical protein